MDEEEARDFDMVASQIASALVDVGEVDGDRDDSMVVTTANFRWRVTIAKES